jgi:hypothetical protein
MIERWPRGLLDPPECPVCGGTARDPNSPACWHCVQGHYADCQYTRDVAERYPAFTAEEKRVWDRLTKLFPEEEILRRLGTLRTR